MDFSIRGLFYRIITDPLKRRPGGSVISLPATGSHLSGMA